MEEEPLIKKTTPLKDILELAGPCQCANCNHGCQFGSGLLAGDDLSKIATFLNISENEAKEKYFEEVEHFNKKMLRPKVLKKDKPYGKCIFFEGKCTIHEVKPLQCKTSMQCKSYGEDLAKWFMVNHIVDPKDPEGVRQYALYLKTHKALPGASLEEIVPDQEKLKKILSFEIFK